MSDAPTVGAIISAAVKTAHSNQPACWPRAPSQSPTANPYADAALTLDEHNAGARANRISLHLAEKKLAEAQQDCTILLAEPEARAVDFALCARVSHALQDRVEERARLDRLLTLTPTHVSALLARAWLNEQENRLADGLADYAKVLELEPESGLAWNNRAWIRIELGEYAAARADADRAVDLEPDSAAARGTRCFALAGLGELEAARSDCVRALELRPTLVDRGMLAFIDERYADARRDWETASEADPAQARQLRPWLAKLPAR